MNTMMGFVKVITNLRKHLLYRRLFHLIIVRHLVTTITQPQIVITNIEDEVRNDSQTRVYSFYDSFNFLFLFLASLIDILLVTIFILHGNLNIKGIFHLDKLHIVRGLQQRVDDCHITFGTCHIL